MQQQLPARWRKAQLSDLVSLRRDTIHPDDAVDLKYVGLEHIDPGNTELLRWGEAHQVTSTKNRFYPGDIIYGKLRPYLDKAVLVNDKGICSTDILVFKPQEVALSEFVAYLVHTQHFINHAMATTTGVNHPRTSWRGLSTFPVFLPPLEEQRVITAVLRTVQEAIAARRREAALERERKAALMQRLFTYGTRGEKLKDTAVGRIPESWEVIRLGTMLEKAQYGISLRGEKEGQYPILRMNCLEEGHVVASDLQYVDLQNDEFDNFQLYPGDVLFNRTNSSELVGKVALFDLEGDFVFASYLIRLVTDTRFLTPNYLNFYLNWVTTQNRLRMLATRGVSQSNISASKLRMFVVALPSLAEQIEIAKVLEACGTKIAALEKESALLNELFQALLEELMSGRLLAIVN